MKKIPAKIQKLYVTYLKQRENTSKEIPFTSNGCDTTWISAIKGVRINNMEFFFILNIIKTKKNDSKNGMVIYYFSPP